MYEIDWKALTLLKVTNIPLLSPLNLTDVVTPLLFETVVVLAAVLAAGRRRFA